MKQILLISFYVFNVLCNLRFKDKEQLERHHSHPEVVDEFLTVHVIPHSHDDVGWLKTVEQYFYGLRNDYQWANVEYVIDSYIEELQRDQSRKFIQVETKFFKMWWDQQNETTRGITRELVQNRQLQFISGGWCMNDEATTYYEDIIDQMTLGHKFLKDTFNYVPNIGWQIDPFGHQNSQAALSYQMGFNAWFFARIDYEDKEARLDKKNMEMIMLPPAEGVQYPIFTHIQYYHYEAPPTFNFDILRRSDAIVDNMKSESYNIKERSEQLVSYFKSQSLHYKSNHLIHTFGSDFCWSNSKVFYQNLDKLIKYINVTPEYNMKLQYSTPEEYIAEINKQNIKFETKQDDFFPYSDEPHAFWTGYFTSRVAIKGYVKRLGRQAQTYKKLIALLYQQEFVQEDYQNITNAIYELDNALAICQHHDAVTGTEKQHVNDDYIKILYKGEQHIQKLTRKILSKFLYNTTTIDYEQCEYNITSQQCTKTYSALKANKTVILTIVDGKVKQENNTDIIRIKVPNLKLLIKDQNNQVIYGDIDCTNGFQDCDLYFKYQIDKNNVIKYFTIQPVLYNESASEILLSVNPFPYTEDTLITLNSTKSFKLKYAYYQSYQQRDQADGAYIFRPSNNSKIMYGNISYTAIGYGRIMSLFRIVRTYTKSVVKNFYHQKETFDIQTYVDQIPVSDSIGKNIIMVIEVPNFNSNKTFYTDSNGLQFQKRIVDYRPQYNYSMHENVSGNYYPVTSAIYIQDGQECVGLLNDRSQGGSSLENGQIEIMIQRRLLQDDSRGVGEALKETDEKGNGLVQNIQHKLTFFNIQNNPNQIRKLQYYLDLQPLVFFNFDSKLPLIPEGLNWFLPFDGFNIEPLLIYGDNLLKFNYLLWNEDEILLRIQNMQEKFSMKIDKLEFVGQAVRTTLTGNQKWNDWKNNSLKWNYDKQVNSLDEDIDDVLYPLQIQTYLIRNSEKSYQQ
ncbi:unnamed protein product (macronuclear) [Paramecium tetraurelia]|uniref:alpha-mannosidase n=1 Tax=Paramecium tetraurelia TaxID=5888 RepID=A0C584_PARTE|nr:uncharacterized protein GSPATT00006450001 [Paramecium tetraurelia]CAK65951.1 unnamed protein product [Paramecium tetraurelia]|eukprot:XP_001433348.1 hypothetical protein (macronuclear) [Paramecium tetraurelia strain d4-2]